MPEETGDRAATRQSGHRTEAVADFGAMLVGTRAMGLCLFPEGVSRYSAAGGVFLLFALAAAPSEATTAIYYSSPENTLGWCAGYSTNRAHTCARQQCEKTGTACKAVLECADGWGAVAFSVLPVKGVGASCGTSKSLFARVVALAKCMVASNSICWTDVTFDGGGATQSRDSDQRFDLTFYVQAMLQAHKYDLADADGAYGPATRAAIAAFEADLDREPTGELTVDLFQTLLVAVTGDQNLARILKRSIVDGREEVLSRRAFGHASAPAPETSYSEQLLAWTTEQQRMALSILVAARSPYKCTQPAQSAVLVGDIADGTWQAVCREGAYQLILGDGGSVSVAPASGGVTPGQRP
jgi:hypothetical protein